MKKPLLILHLLNIIILLSFIAGCDNRSSNTNTGYSDSDTKASDSAVIQKFIKLETRTSDEYGEYLTDDQGRSLYLFKADNNNESTCYDDCAEAWPPILTGGEPEAGNNVKASLIGTITRKIISNRLLITIGHCIILKKIKEPVRLKGRILRGMVVNGILYHLPGKRFMVRTIKP